MSEPTLNELCSLIVDSEHKTAPKDPDGLHPLMRTTNLSPAHGDFSGAQRVSAATYELWTKRARPQTDDLILAREAPVGGVCRVPADVRPVLGQRTVLLRPQMNVDSRFLMYRLAADDLQARMAEMATGATVPHLNMADIRAFTVPNVPDLGQQRRLAALLGAFDTLIEISERRIELLEELARSLYREWFVRFRFPGHEDTAFLSSSVGPIPRGWEATSLGSIAKWLSGGTPSTKAEAYWGGGIPWITSGTLTTLLLNESPRTLTAAGVAAGSRLVERDTLLFVVRGMSLVREFRVGIADRTLAFGQDCKALVAADGVDPLFLAFTVLDRQHDIQGMVELAGHGTGKLATDRLMAILLPAPPTPIQTQFGEAVRPIRELMSVVQESSRQLTATRDLLLPRLVTGRLDISDIDLGDLLPSEAA